jgi:hypothetical protein
MSDLTAKFTTLEGQLAAQAEVMQGYVDQVEELLDLVNTALNTLNDNGATNTRYLLDALSKQDPCATCPPPSILIPPIDGTVVPPTTTTCKKAQAFLAYMNSAMVMLDLVSGLGTGTFPSLLLSAYQEVIDSSAAYAGVPLISFSEGVTLIGKLINYGILNIGRGDTLQAQFATVSGGLLPLLYAATSATEAKSIYHAYIDGLGLPSDELAVMNAGAYDGLFDWFFSPAGTPDLTPYSGDVCGAGLAGITSCVDVTAALKFDGDGYRYHLLAPPTVGEDAETVGDFFGFSFEEIDGTSGKATRVVYRPAGGGARAFATNLFVDNPSYTFAFHTSTIDMYTDVDGPGTKIFTVRVCPPE